MRNNRKIRKGRKRRSIMKIMRSKEGWKRRKRSNIRMRIKEIKIINGRKGRE